MPLFYVFTLFIILFQHIRCEDYIIGVFQDVSTTCNITQDCNRKVGGSTKICLKGVCVCKPDTYESNDSCLQCSGFQESCEDTNCCAFSRISSCIDNVCLCKYNADITDFSSCWRHTQGKQNILSFAKLLLGAILALSLASLFGILRQLCNRPDVIESSTMFQRSFPYESFNSIQRYVMQKLKDRPPRYEDIQKENGGAGPSPSSSQSRVGRSSIPGSRGTLPPAYQTYSTPSSSLDLTIPPPPYSASPEDPTDLFIPPESYTRPRSESTPLVFHIGQGGGIRNNLYQSIETMNPAGDSVCVTSTSQLTNQASPGGDSANDRCNGGVSSGEEQFTHTSSTSKDASCQLRELDETLNTTESSGEIDGLNGGSSSDQFSASIHSGTSKLPAYSEVEILLSPRVMNEAYTRSLQRIPTQKEQEGMEYLVGNERVIVSKVVESEKSNVPDVKLMSDMNPRSDGTLDLAGLPSVEVEIKTGSNKSSDEVKSSNQKKHLEDKTSPDREILLDKALNLNKMVRRVEDLNLSQSKEPENPTREFPFQTSVEITDKTKLPVEPENELCEISIEDTQSDNTTGKIEATKPVTHDISRSCKGLNQLENKTQNFSVCDNTTVRTSKTDSAKSSTIVGDPEDVAQVDSDFKSDLFDLSGVISKADEIYRDWKSINCDKKILGDDISPFTISDQKKADISEGRVCSADGNSYHDDLNNIQERDSFIPSRELHTTKTNNTPFLVTVDADAFQDNVSSFLSDVIEENESDDTSCQVLDIKKRQMETKDSNNQGKFQS